MQKLLQESRVQRREQLVVQRQTLEQEHQQTHQVARILQALASCRHRSLAQPLPVRTPISGQTHSLAPQFDRMH